MSFFLGPRKGKRARFRLIRRIFNRSRCWRGCYHVAHGPQQARRVCKCLRLNEFLLWRAGDCEFASLLFRRKV